MKFWGYLCLLLGCVVSVNAKPLKVGFFLEHLLVRGTEVAVYDYADFNETLLGNESVVIFVNLPLSYWDTPKPQDRPPTVRELFSRRFGSHFYECYSLQEMDQILLKEGVDVLYLLKGGRKDQKLSSVTLNAVHAVFPPLEPHGDIYASISDWLSRSELGGTVPYVPHMVRLDETKQTLHDELGIPKDAVVFGRHGGFESFDLPFAQQAVINVAVAHPDWFFLFLNTEQFCNLPNVMFFASTPDLAIKTKFINTCDAMIHARSMGESFGLACAEFSIQNKPILTWSGHSNAHYHRSHLGILGNKGLYYDNQEQLVALMELVGENISVVRSMDWDAYSEKYNPRVVMKKFDDVFLQPVKEMKK